MSGVAAFNLALAKFARETVPEKVAQMQRVIMLNALRGVVYRTPVDTGRARSNWSVSIGEKDMSTRDAFAAGSKLGADETGNAEATIQDGAAVIAQIQPFSVTYLQNNLPYIEALESGTGSKQAPNGMLAVTIAEIEATL